MSPHEHYSNLSGGWHFYVATRVTNSLGWWPVLVEFGKGLKSAVLKVGACSPKGSDWRRPGLSRNGPESREQPERRKLRSTRAAAKILVPRAWKKRRSQPSMHVPVPQN